MSGDPFRPVTPETCHLVQGPFYHGTRIALGLGELISPGYPSNYEQARVLSHIYFSALVEPAVWGAELAVAFAGGAERGRVYIVEPTGRFEDDPKAIRDMVAAIRDMQRRGLAVIED